MVWSSSRFNVVWRNQEIILISYVVTKHEEGGIRSTKILQGGNVFSSLREDSSN